MRPAPPTTLPDQAETKLKIRCEAGHRWIERWPMPMTLTAFSRRMSAVALCPTCDAPTFLGWPKENADV